MCTLTARITMTVALALTVPACDPVPIIKDFQVHPLGCCAGSEVTIQWITENGATSITASPEFRMPIGAVGNTGTESRAVQETTIITLAVSGNGKQRSTKTVTVVPDGGVADFKLAAEGRCIGNQPVWIAPSPPADWGAGLLVSQVTNLSSSTVTVLHGSTGTSLSPLATTAQFADQSLGGDWRVQPSQLLPEWTCSAGSALQGGTQTVLPPLILNVRAYCPRR
jgi:hypothetical protein